MEDGWQLPADVRAVRSDAAALAVTTARDFGRSDDPHTRGARDQTPSGRAHAVPYDGRACGQLPGYGAAFHTGAVEVPAGPANERRGVTHFRDERAGWRDHAARATSSRPSVTWRRTEMIRQPSA